MEDVILIWRMFNSLFSIILYNLQVMKLFYLASNIMTLYKSSGVTLSPTIVRECMSLTPP